MNPMYQSIKISQEFKGWMVVKLTVKRDRSLFVIWSSNKNWMEYRAVVPFYWAVRPVRSLSAL